jgi:hypothetical protein
MLGVERESGAPSDDELREIWSRARQKADAI